MVGMTAAGHHAGQSTVLHAQACPPLSHTALGRAPQPRPAKKALASPTPCHPSPALIIQNPRGRAASSRRCRPRRSLGLNSSGVAGRVAEACASRRMRMCAHPCARALEDLHACMQHRASCGGMSRPNPSADRRSAVEGASATPHDGAQHARLRTGVAMTCTDAGERRRPSTPERTGQSPDPTEGGHRRANSSASRERPHQPCRHHGWSRALADRRAWRAIPILPGSDEQHLIDARAEISEATSCTGGSAASSGRKVQRR